MDITPDLHQVSFDGPLAVVWHDRPVEGARLPATGVGCLPDERITVRDMFTNELASGRAGEIALDLSRGALYVEGSRQMAAIARAEGAIRVEPSQVALGAGGTARVELSAPPGAEVSVEADSRLPVTPDVRLGKTRTRVALVAHADALRSSGRVCIRVRLEPPALGLTAPAEITRWVTVSVGEPNLVRDGAFLSGHLFEWQPERGSDFAWDPDEGHDAPGSLRLDGPFDRRLVQRGIELHPGRPVRMRCWVKTDHLEGCIATLNLVLWAKDKWLRTWCLAATRCEDADLEGATLAPNATLIPEGTNEWTLVEADLAAEGIPSETTRAAFYVDVKGGGTGTTWMDDLDLWQPETE